MKSLSYDTKKKLKYFMEQKENKEGIVVFLSIISYLILLGLTKKVVILLCGYIFFYVLYTKIYKLIYFKLFRDFVNRDEF